MSALRSPSGLLVWTRPVSICILKHILMLTRRPSTGFRSGLHLRPQATIGGAASHDRVASWRPPPGQHVTQDNLYRRILDAWLTWDIASRLDGGDGWLAGCCSRSFYLLSAGYSAWAVMGGSANGRMLPSSAVLRHENAGARQSAGLRPSRCRAPVVVRSAGAAPSRGAG